MPEQLANQQAALARIQGFLSDSTERVLIGIIGKPGAGKSTLSKFLMSKLPKEFVTVVPMDGYHLSNKVLKELKRADRKGAPDTFESDLSKLKTSIIQYLIALSKNQSLLRA